ncbi:hypothetical protein A2Z00_01475 [Candidatus Gottesmanbacteria bacterium RBG_13_45_10]|uniref:Fibronectin type-III domain-containing protein n=1 Tax=Candidatus Gottesmanbacteria bacterium RBG_13_45_10 TaxID=1798370 RepID=A0A1F5ZHN0_9BACT|nr:MAG: hypothetical protein A2Z00_01475 [Candidatus Gottesmanbacteria bacterium RBG_13_45_10]
MCQYIDGKCGAYSNDISVKAPSGGESSGGNVASITLTGQKAESNKVGLTWTVNGTSSQGFKVVWSKNSGPTYPCRSEDSNQYHYDSNPEARSNEVGDLETGKTYYFRVCEYLGGTCGTYSNEVSVGL